MVEKVEKGNDNKIMDLQKKRHKSRERNEAKRENIRGKKQRENIEVKTRKEEEKEEDEEEGENKKKKKKRKRKVKMKKKDLKKIYKKIALEKKRRISYQLFKMKTE